MKRYLGFDIEIAKVLPDGVTDLLAHKPLGISCAAAVASDLAAPLVWHGRDASGKPGGQMSAAEVASMLEELERLTASGYTIVTWNGAAFDFPVVADECGLVQRCAALTAGHVDMLFQAVCTLGHYISLKKAAEGMKLPGKTEGMSGILAPTMWAEGRCQEVIDYCVQDSRLTLALADAAERAGHLRWITMRGSPKQFDVAPGWLTVREAVRLPLPDTSWMTSPPSRGDLLGWMPAGSLS
jgi:hypothetical protein